LILTIFLVILRQGKIEYYLALHNRDMNGGNQNAMPDKLLEIGKKKGERVSD
jgi:hypothetical protein